MKKDWTKHATCNHSPEVAAAPLAVLVLGPAGASTAHRGDSGGTESDANEAALFEESCVVVGPRPLGKPAGWVCEPVAWASQGPAPAPWPCSPSPSQGLVLSPQGLPSCPDRLVSRRPEHLHSGHRRAAALPGPVDHHGSVWHQGRSLRDQKRQRRSA